MGVVLAFAPLSPFFGVLVGSVVLLSGPNDDADLWSAMVDRFFAEDAAEDLIASVASAKCPNFSKVNLRERQLNCGDGLIRIVKKFIFIIVNSTFFPIFVKSLL